jgi:hypothetical protein
VLGIQDFAVSKITCYEASANDDIYGLPVIVTASGNSLAQDSQIRQERLIDPVRRFKRLFVSDGEVAGNYLTAPEGLH